MNEPTMSVYFRGDHVETFQLAESVEPTAMHPDDPAQWLKFPGKGGPIFLNSDDVSFISVDNGDQQ